MIRISHEHAFDTAVSNLERTAPRLGCLLAEHPNTEMDSRDPLVIA